MDVASEIFKLLTGIVIFLLGASYLEDSIKSLAGRSFKLFLRKQTTNKLKAIGGGAIVTGVLQSSSVVSLMVLAFVGAGVIQMESALAVILGANLGTTIDSWVVATLGFKFNIENISYPVAAISGLSMLLSNKDGRLYQWSRLLFGIAFLFVGLNFIKTGMQDVINEIDLSSVKEQPAIIFLVIGLLITAVIQSSSPTVVIVLSALHVNAIGLYEATAIILGAEVGSPLKLILASIKGSADKKRVAFGVVFFNITMAVLMLLVLRPVNTLITDIIGLKDELLALVFFQSLVNITGIIIFYPLLGPIGRFLEKRFVKEEDETLFIHKVNVTDTDPALVALEKETEWILYHTTAFAMEAFDLKTDAFEKLSFSKEFITKKVMEKYEHIKHQHGDIYNYATRLQRHVTDKETNSRIYQLLDAARNIMYAAKNIKDALPDIELLSKSSKDQKYNSYIQTRKRIADFFENTITLVNESSESENFKKISLLYKGIQKSYKEMLSELHREDLHKKIDEVEFSTIVNFNREIFTCEKSIAFALKDLLLSEEESIKFDDLPGFIR